MGWYLILENQNHNLLHCSLKGKWRQQGRNRNGLSNRILGRPVAMVVPNQFVMLLQSAPGDDVRSLTGLSSANEGRHLPPLPSFANQGRSPLSTSLTRFAIEGGSLLPSLFLPPSHTFPMRLWASLPPQLFHRIWFMYKAVAPAC